MDVIIDGTVYTRVQDVDGLGDWFPLLAEEDLVR